MMAAAAVMVMVMTVRLVLLRGDNAVNLYFTIILARFKAFAAVVAHFKRVQVAIQALSAVVANPVVQNALLCHIISLP